MNISGECPAEVAQLRYLRWRKAARVALLILTITTGSLVLFISNQSVMRVSDHNEYQPMKWMGTAFGLFLVQSLLLGLISFFSGAALSPSHKVSSTQKFLFFWSLSALTSCFLVVSIMTRKGGLPVTLPSFAGLLWGFFIGVAGTWLGATWIRSRGTLRWLLIQPTVVASLSVILIGCGVTFALSNDRLEIQAASVSSNDRRQLVAHFREHDPRELEQGETDELNLSEAQLNQLLGWGLSKIPGNHLGRAEFNLDQADIQISIALPENPLVSSFLNLHTAGKVISRNGQVGFHPQQVQLGSIEIPKALLQLSGPLMIHEKLTAPAVQEFLKAIVDIQIGEQGATVTYQKIIFSKESIRETLVQVGLIEDLEEAVAVQVDELIKLTKSKPNFTFVDCVNVAFQIAKQSSVQGDPVKENRAALLALGYALGHQRLHFLLGERVPKLDRATIRKFRNVKLGNRQDWTRHFSLSAALEVLSNAELSRDIGLLKEELDADGGSGFSFADLLADRSGTMLAAKATQTKKDAIRLQKLLAEPFKESILIPAGNDLPEGLTDKEFQTQYGGVGGEKYNELLKEIDRRIAACNAYQE